MTDSKIVIIGSGFIGSSLAKYLNDYFSVTTISINSQPDWLIKENISHKICDILDYEKLSNEIQNASIVINSAILRIPKILENNQKGYSVNVLGTENICKIVSKNQKINGLINIGTISVLGEKEIGGIIEEKKGYHPDKLEDRSRLYVITKILQESIIRFFDEIHPDKFFGTLRVDSVIGENMHNDFVVNRFIDQALSGQDISIYKHSQYKMMAFTAMSDICKAVKQLIDLILSNPKFSYESENHILNLVYSKSYTITQLGNMVKESVVLHSGGKIIPKVMVIDKGISEKGEKKFNEPVYDLTKIQKILKLDNFISPKIAIDEIIKSRLK